MNGRVHGTTGTENVVKTNAEFEKKAPVSLGNQTRASRFRDETRVQSPSATAALAALCFFFLSFLFALPFLRFPKYGFMISLSNSFSNPP